jgi:NADH dehydrogenase [ubiquinone] 1 alpha subcomplex assembly factor 7
LSRDGLRVLLETRGTISVAEFMDWCLTGRIDAYYRVANPIGREGDFITAPEISQIFGELIGIWTGTVWQSMGRPSPVMLLELGPGRGTLMSDALRALRVVPGFLDAAQVHLIERSERLRRAQGESLAHFSPTWHEDLDSVPDGAAIVIANEFFDALPVAQYVMGEDGWRERVIGLGEDGEPVFAVGEPADPPLTVTPDQQGLILEIRSAARPYIEALGKRARSFPVAGLVIDYGYFSDGFGDTLQAMSRHGYVDPLVDPGEVDISTSVNFAELARMAEASGLSVWGPISQDRLLFELGLEARLQRVMAAAGNEQREHLLLGARRISDPFKMGGLFKAIALASAGLSAPPPFTASFPVAVREE